jgi:hypothetical protein
MGKRYKEFLIDIIVKSYQIILAVMIVTPIATKAFDLPLLVTGTLIIMVLILWGGVVSAKMEA